MATKPRSVPRDPEVRTARAALATAARLHRGGPTVDEAKRFLAERAITAAIQRAIDSAPPLTDEQADRIVALIRVQRGEAA